MTLEPATLANANARQPAPIFSRPRIYVGAVLFSLLTALLHSGPLNGTLGGLILIVGLQVYLPGILIARILGKLDAAIHPISRFAWVLTSGIGLTVCLGTLFTLKVSIADYILVLHGIMLLLALFPTKSTNKTAIWRISSHNAPLYLVVLLCCLVILAISIELNRFRFVTFFDETSFISLADWQANDPESPTLISRVIEGTALQGGQAQGWTYTNAAWVWSSGVSADRVIWHYLTPLFAPAIPLIIFALGYELTGREETGAWSVAALTLFAILTINLLQLYNPGWSFGQYALFNLRTLRTISIGLILPLTLFCGLAFLETFSIHDLIPAVLTSVVLVSLHPRPVLILVVSIGATLVIKVVTQPKRWLGKRTLVLALLLVLLLPYPTKMLLTRLSSQSISSSPTTDCAFGTASGITSTNTFTGFDGYVDLSVLIFTLPIVGQTYVMAPDTIFYHPFVWLAAIMGLLAVFRLRKDRAAPYLFGATLAALAVSFALPALAYLAARITSIDVGLGNVCRLPEILQSGTLYNIAGTTIFALPVAFSLGYGMDTISRLIWAHVSRFGRYATPLMSGMLILVILFLVIEPIPIAIGARAQLTALHQNYDQLQIQPPDEQMLDMLKAKLPQDRHSIIMAPNRVLNAVIESVPHTLVAVPTAAVRFFAEGDTPAPWLDTADLNFLSRTGVNYIVIEANSARLPGLLLQPDRFKLVDAVAGYQLFQVQGALQPTPTDAMFARMNIAYGTLQDPRWHPRGGFKLVRPADAAAWQAIADGWHDLLAGQPDDDLMRYGQAFTDLMMGHDDLALPVWRSLHDQHPQITQFTDALCYTLAETDYSPKTIQPLLNALKGQDIPTQVLAAQSLLTEQLFYLMTDAQVAQAVAISETATDVWEELVERERVSELQARAALILGRSSANTASVAEHWLERLPEVSRSTSDVMMQAVALLSQDQVDQALAVLRQATDPEWLAPKIWLHPDRWQDNIAAQTYYLLRGELAFRGQHWSDAEAAYQQAITQGAYWAGGYFLAKAYESDGHSDDAKRLMAELNTKWAAEHQAPFPELASLLTVADNRASAVMQPHLDQGADARQVSLEALFGASYAPYPIRAWRIVLTNPTGTQYYADLEQPAVTLNGALVHARVNVPIPDLPTLTPVRVLIEPRFSNVVLWGPITFSAVVNRPPSASPDSGTKTVNLQFGPDIFLRGYQVNISGQTMIIKLYWWAEATPPADYQVFVHIMADNQFVGLLDSSPLNGTYPTSSWRPQTLIADTYTVTLKSLSSAGAYQLHIGMYHLPDMTRLPLRIDNQEAGTEAVLQP